MRCDSIVLSVLLATGLLLAASRSPAAEPAAEKTSDDANIEVAVPEANPEDPPPASGNPLFDDVEGENLPMPTPDMRALIEQMLQDDAGLGELPAPEGPALRPESLDEAKLIELGRRIIGGVAVIQAYDDEGTRVGRSAGFFVNDRGLLATDPMVLGETGASLPAYMTVVLGDGTSHRVVGIAGTHGKTGTLFLQTDAANTSALPLDPKPVPSAGEKCAVIGFNEERGLILADAVAKPAPSAEGTAWLKVAGENTAGIAGSPVIDRAGRVRGIVALEFELGAWTNYALPLEGFAKVAVKAAAANLAPISKAAFFRPAGETSNQAALLAAAESLRENRNARAARQLARMASNQPRDAAVWALYGLATRRLGAFEESAEAFRKAAALKPDAASTWYQLALSELMRETGNADPRQTLAALEKAAEAGANDKAAWLLFGQSALRAAEYPRAARAFLRVVELEPDYADGFYFLAVAQAKSGNLIAAQSSIGRCVKLAPRHARAWFLLGLIYTKAGNLTDAASALEKAVSANPDDQSFRRNLIHVYLKLGRKAQARALHDEARKSRINTGTAGRR
jgi:Flp pilus assembly protein TadD